VAAIAGRYARAFAEVAAAHKMDPDKTIEELEQLAALFTESRELHNVFLNPAVPHGQKIKLLDAIVRKTAGSAMMRNFLAVLMDHRRIGLIGEIAKEFREQLDAHLGIANAQVSSARTLSAAEKRTLESQLADITGKTIRARYSEDPGLLGGAVVRIGSTIYDGSVHGQLEKIRQQIAGA
jgi:F-type H+-transporting ATPase subunit delta